MGTIPEKRDIGLWASPRVHRNQPGTTSPGPRRQDGHAPSTGTFRSVPHRHLENPPRSLTSHSLSTGRRASSAAVVRVLDPRGERTW